MVWECRRSKEEGRELLGEDAVEVVRLGLKEVMGNECVEQNPVAKKKLIRKLI